MRLLNAAAVGIGVASLVLVAGSAVSAPTAKPAHLGPAGPTGTLQHAPMVLSSGSKLRSTTLVSNFSGATLTPGGFTPIDPGETITCPGHTTCTVEADLNVQAQGSGSSDAWALCAALDGGFATCPYLGFLDSSFFQSGTFAETFVGVTPGSHTVQTSVFAGNGGTAYNYTFVYHVYTP